jgi:endonuclease G
LVEKTGIDFHLPINNEARKGRVENNTPSELSKTRAHTTLIGGWYPVFFDDDSVGKLNSVIANIKSGKVAGIQVQYDHNEALAKKIVSQIEAQTNLQPSLIQSSPPESSTVTYERNRVTLIVRSK